MWNNLNHQFIILHSKCSNGFIILGFKNNRHFYNFNLLQFYSSLTLLYSLIFPMPGDKY